MPIGALLTLAVVVVIVAYVLGRLAGRAGGAATARPTPARPGLFGPAPDREAQLVVSWLLAQAFEQTGIRVAEDKVAYQRVVEAAQKALHELKSQPAAVISLPYLTADSAGPKHFEIRLTRDVIRELVRD